MSGVFPDSGVPASQTTNTVDVETTGCGAAGELFHSTSRCTPRFDPASANAVISEILNAVTKNCDGTDSAQPYDCSRLDNLLLAICRHWNDGWTGCFSADLPMLADVCGTVQQVVLVDDGECKRFALYSSATAERYVGTFAAAQSDRLGEDVNGLIVPRDFLASGSVYTIADIRADWLANTIDNSLINNSKITRAVFTQACPQALDMETVLSIDQPATAADAYDNRGRLGYRYRVNGGAWTYGNTGGSFTTGLPFNSLQAEVKVQHSLPIIPAGLVEIETFYVKDAGTDNVRINANTFAVAPPIPTPRSILTLSQ